MFVSIEKGQYGQWIITAEMNGYFVHEQYYFMTKKQALQSAKWGIKSGVFGKANS